MANLLDWAEKSLSWQQANSATFLGSDIEQAFPSFYRVAKAGHKQRDNVRGYVNRIKEHWGQNIMENDMVSSLTGVSENSAKELAALARADPDFNHARDRLNRALLYDSLSTY